MVNEEIDHLEKLLNGLEFDELERLLTNRPFVEIEDILYQLAYNPVKDKSNLLVYTFMQKLLSNNETARLHMSVSRLMGLILNHIDNAESIGLFHGLRAAQLDPDNVDIMEYLLYYNHIPERLLEDEVAIEFAQKIILIRPQSKAAMLTLAKIRN